MILYGKPVADSHVIPKHTVGKTALIARQRNFVITFSHQRKWRSENAAD